MKLKITFLIIAVITLALVYFIVHQYKALEQVPSNSPSSTSKQTPLPVNQNQTAQQATKLEPKNTKSLKQSQYKQLVTQFKQRLGKSVAVSIQNIATAKSVLINKKIMTVDEVVITTKSDKYGTNSFQAFIDPQTQVILKQWNFKRKDGLFIKYNRPKPLHPSGEIKR